MFSWWQDIDKYKYSKYGIGFDKHEFLSHPTGETGKNLIIFGVDMSLSTKIYKKKKDILKRYFFLVKVLHKD